MSKISRSVFQTVMEENKRLKRDLKAIVYDVDTIESQRAFRKWFLYYKDQADFNTAIAEIIFGKVKLEQQNKELKNEQIHTDKNN